MIELFDTSEGFALQSESQYLPPSQRARLEDLETELVGVQPPPPPRKPVFRLSPAELAKIDRNMARISHFKDPGTVAMF